MKTFGSGSTVAALIVLLASGCSRPTVKVYDVPKEEASARSFAEQSSQTNVPEDRGWIRWTKPEQWTELAPTAFRKGNYVFEDESEGKVEITVSSFPGDVGGTLANVNRWRGQAGLSPISQGELAASLSDLTIDGHHGQIVDILPEDEDTQAARIVAAIFMYRGESWFFKMSGPKSIVAGQKPIFDNFIESLKFLENCKPNGYNVRGKKRCIVYEDDMKRNNGFIPGIKPGSETSDFISNVMDRVTLPGSILLAVVAILPAFAMMFGVSQGFAQFYGGTSLLIMVGVILDTLQQIESYLLMRHYDGMMKSGKVKGRSI